MKSLLAAFTMAAIPIVPAHATDLRRGWTTPEQQLTLLVAVGTFTSSRCAGLSFDNQRVVDWALSRGRNTQDMSAARSASFIWVARLERAPADEACSEIINAFGPGGFLMPDVVGSK